ncbi:hypothetical protein [Burkholderia cepacia]|uniref:hypothetical protein n=1 Tax=Burkholderia cepacia TaxID=292 RepID=UPI000A6B1275|nr:hypothetical protein [Burkholderia cepacia]
MKRMRTEELKLVFALQDAVDSTTGMFGTNEIGFHSRKGVISPFDAINILVDGMQEFGIEATFVENGRHVSAASVVKRIKKKGAWGHVETSELSFQYGVAASGDHCFIIIQEKIANAAGDWGRWVVPFAALSGFVQAWIVDVEYNYWQNVKDPLEYEVANRDFSGLPMKSNGLPAPLDQLEVDTSKNPGRWILRAGYVEAIGATMWLSDLFWMKVGGEKKSRITSSGFIEVRDLENGVMEIQVQGGCFVSVETSDLQNRLREILYE